MKESYGEGLASHTGPESWRAAREDGTQALTGVRAGRVWSHESVDSPGCRRRPVVRKATPATAISRAVAGPRVVGDLAHARKLLAQDLGDPTFDGRSDGAAARMVNPKGARP